MDKNATQERSSMLGKTSAPMSTMFKPKREPKMAPKIPQENDLGAYLDLLGLILPLLGPPGAHFWPSWGLLGFILPLLGFILRLLGPLGAHFAVPGALLGPPGVHSGPPRVYSGPPGASWGSCWA